MTPVEIRLPELSGSTEAEQLRQIRSYLYSLASQLQYAFDGAEQEQQTALSTPRTAARQEETPTLSSIKSLIIRSAEITQRIAEKLETRLSGKYVAQSQFGTFTQLTEQRIAASAEELRQEFTNWQRIETDVEQIRSSLLEVSASIRTGLLYEQEDGPVYGVEIGQQEREDGVVRFRKFARLTADRLSFFDRNDTEVAYVSDSALHVTSAEAASLTAGAAAVQRLQLGQYTWQLGGDGHLTLN